MPPEPHFDPLGYIRRLEQIQADLMSLRTDTDAQLARILRNQTAILAAVNKPAWLTTAPSPPALAGAAPKDATSTPTAPLPLAPVITIDYGGQIYVAINNIFADLNSLVTQGQTAMATEAQIQQAVDSMVATIGTLQTDVNNLTTADTALDTAVTNLENFIKNNPGTAIPDSLLTEVTTAQSNLQGLHNSISGATADLGTQTASLASADQATAVSVAVSPANPTVSLASAQTQQFTASAMMSDGTSKDVTSSATWASDTPATASVNAAGLATLVAAGTATISAMVGSVTGSTVLTVTA